MSGGVGGTGGRDFGDGGLRHPNLCLAFTGQGKQGGYKGYVREDIAMDSEVCNKTWHSSKAALRFTPQNLIVRYKTCTKATQLVPNYLAR